MLCKLLLMQQHRGQEPDACSSSRIDTLQGCNCKREHDALKRVLAWLCQLGCLSSRSCACTVVYQHCGNFRCIPPREANNGSSITLSLSNCPSVEPV